MTRRDLTFRVFVSSTFSDLKAERNALQENAFPRLRAYCQEKGARFQVIDLRWGVSEEAALDQQTMNICIQELKRCQVVSPRPNFIILLGERYGWRPLLPQIEASEFEMLLEHVPTNQRPLLLEWYKRDENAIPPEYCLQPRKLDIGDNHTDQEKQAAHDAEARRWSEQIEPLLHELLVRAAREVLPDAKDTRRQKYEDSATHQEIRYGAFKAEDPQSHVFAYFRTVEGLPEDDRAKDFLDIKDGTIDSEAHDRLLALKRELRSLLPPEHVCEYTAQWRDGQPQSDLKALCDRVESDLRQIIDSELVAFQQASELEREIQAHKEFGQQRAEHFIGRQEILEKIQAYLAGENNRPLVIHGVSGSGKTALLARAIQMANKAFPDAGAIFRFIGATPSSSDGRSLLESLCQQIYETFNFEEQKRNLIAQIKDNDKEAQERRQCTEEEYSVPSEYQKLSTTFRDFLTKIPKARKLILFLDALDQLSDTDHARSLSWLPDKLPENVRLIVSCLPDECLSILQRRVPQQNIVELKPMPREEGEKLLDIWLHDAGRTLQANQQSEVLGKFQQCGLPLYLKLAFEESRLWKSYAEKVELSLDIPGIIRDLLSRLSLDANHGQMMISRSLGYLAAAKNGLTEDELLDVLSLDKDVISDFLRRSPKSPAVEHLPVVVWSRLYFDLKPYLTERTADGTSLMAFYHPQFGEVVAEEFLSGEVKKTRHQGLAEYFAKQSLWTEKNKEKNPNLRKVSELPYQQTYGELWDEIEKTLCDLHFIEAKCAAGMTYHLIHDYNVALDALPEAQPEKQERLKHEARLKKYTEDLIAYAKGEIKTLDIIPSVEPWSEERIKQDTERIINNPTRLDRIRAFSQFVNSESHGLVKFASHPGFVVQQAYNSARSGPFAIVAEAMVKTEVHATVFLRYAFQRPDYNPHPALIRTLAGHRDGVGSVNITPDGTKAVLSSRNRTLQVWDLGSGECIRTIEGPTDSVANVSMTPDGKRAVCGGDDGTLRLWDLDSAECLRTLKGHKDSVSSVSVTPDGKRAVSGDGGGALRLWDLDSGECLRTLKGHTNSVSSISVTPDGKRAISGSGSIVKLSNWGTPGELKVWDLDRGECVRMLEGHTSDIYGVSMTPDGKTAISGSGDGTLRLWDIQSGECIKTLKGHTDDIYRDVYSVSITPDGKRAVSGGADCTVRLWELDRGECIRTLEGDRNGVYSVVVTAHGERAIAGCDSTREGYLGGTVYVWNLEGVKFARTLEGRWNDVDSISTMPDGKIAVSGSFDKTLRVWDLESGECLSTLRGHTEWVESVKVTPDGKRAISGSMDKTIRLWDIKSRECLKTLRGHTEPVDAVSVSSDGRRAISGSWDKTIRMWDLENGECLGTLEGHGSSIDSVVVTSDGKSIISGSLDKSIKLWDIKSGKCLKTLRGHMGRIIGLDVTPDGKEAISGSEDQTIRVWDLRSGECLRKLEGHRYSVEGVSVTPDGKWVVSGGWDNTLRVWDRYSGQCLAIYQAESSVTSVSEMRASRRFVVGTHAGEVIFVTPLNLPTETPIVTPVRLWLSGEKPSWLFGKKMIEGRWDKHITIVCLWCGRRFPVSDKILDLIRTINHNANLSPDQSPCLELPAKAWEEPRLLSECPICHNPLKYNPFIVDNRERY